MKESIRLNRSDEAFDAFVDDCLLSGDPICNPEANKRMELVASQIIQGIWEDNDYITA